MAIASERDSRVVRGGVVQSFSIGDQANPLLIRNMKGGPVLYASLNGGNPDPEALLSDGDTQRIPAGEYLLLPGGGSGPYTVRLVTSSTDVRGARVQTVELGPAVNVDPGTTGGIRDSLLVSPIAETPTSTVVGTGAGPLLIVNDSDVRVFLTVNSGTDPDTSETSTDPATFALDARDWMVLEATGTGYEVRAQLAPFGTTRGALWLVEVQ